MPASYLSRRAPSRPLVVLLLALLLGTAAVAGAPAAHAERVRHRDATHDVRQTRDGRPGSTAAPGRAEPDIERVMVSYNRHRLKLVVHLRKLSPQRNHAALTQIVTPRYTAGVYVTRIPSLDLESVSLIRGAGVAVDCPSLSYRMWFVKDVVEVVVPRSCLGSPRWVRAGFALSWTTTRSARSDDALSPDLSGAATLTRRLRVG